MADFHLAIQTVLRHEGGYVNDPADCGGETKFGICQRSYPKLKIRDLDVAAAEAIYQRDFWQPLRLDEIHDQSVATKVIDTAVLIGRFNAVKLLQRAVPQAGGGLLRVDGKIGPNTLTAINLCSPALLLIAYRKLLATYYETLAVNIPTNQNFLKGWLNRANS
jgi:lysozyme family protein